MKPIRLVALDVDGTLLDPREEVRPRVRSAIREAIEQGCLVTLATGRRFAGASHIAEDLGLALPLIRHGGAAVPGAAPLLTRWTLIDDDALEIFRRGCSKASAVAHLAAAHGIGMDEVMAIGDGLNDCEILAAVGLGVAMGNACPEARAAAR